MKKYNLVSIDFIPMIAYDRLARELDLTVCDYYPLLALYMNAKYIGKV
jgi:hypothetical protein